MLLLELTSKQKEIMDKIAKLRPDLKFELLHEMTLLPTQNKRTSYIKKQWERILLSESVTRIHDEKAFVASLGMQEDFELAISKQPTNKNQFTASTSQKRRLSPMEIVDFERKAIELFLRDPTITPERFDLNIINEVDKDSSSLLNYQLHLLHNLINNLLLPRTARCASCGGTISRDNGDSIVYHSTDKDSLKAFHENCFTRKFPKVIRRPMEPTPVINTPQSSRELISQLHERNYPIVGSHEEGGVLAIDIQTRDMNYATITFDQSTKTLYFGTEIIRTLDDLEIL